MRYPLVAAVMMLLASFVGEASAQDMLNASHITVQINVQDVLSNSSYVDAQVLLDVQSDDDWSLGVSRDATFMGGATLLGLVVFGTLLNVLFMRSGDKPPYGKWEVYIIFAGLAVVLAFSWGLMVLACCLGDYIELLFGVCVWAIFLSAIAVLATFAGIVESLLKRRKSDTPKDD